ncbi:MAG: TSUP family transporter [Thermoanaerobaculaceae bacterium]|nr:TSUP family transporter [Thermoanaerobaculaceae bacterium]
MFDSPLTLTILFFGGLLAGTMDTIAGGGGIITVPLLFSFPITSLQVFGTNKFQSTFGSFSATFNFFIKGKYKIKLLIGVFFTAIGSFFGAYCVGIVPSDILRKIVPFMLYSIAIFLYFYKNYGIEKKEVKMNENLFYLLFGLSIGFYDGFFGPGTGTFWAILFVHFLGMDLREATINTKLMNFTSNIIPLMFFLSKGSVLFLPGIAMASGQFLGGFIGAKIVLKKGAKIIKPILIFIAIVLATKLIIDSWF